MALDFHSKLTRDQKSILEDFSNEELAKVARKKRRLSFLASRMATYRDELDSLQNESLKYLSSTLETSVGKRPQINYVPPPIQEKTKEEFERQTAHIAGAIKRAPPESLSTYSRPLISASVDEIKIPLLEAVKGRFERLEYAIRRSADRVEVLGERSTKQDTLSADVKAALLNIDPEE